MQSIFGASNYIYPACSDYKPPSSLAMQYSMTCSNCTIQLLGRHGEAVLCYKISRELFSRGAGYGDPRKDVCISNLYRAMRVGLAVPRVEHPRNGNLEVRNGVSENLVEFLEKVGCGLCRPKVSILEAVMFGFFMHRVCSDSMN